jgi:hypothetical protein
MIPELLAPPEIPMCDPNWPFVPPAPPFAAVVASTLNDAAPVIADRTRTETAKTIARLGICAVDMLADPEHVIVSSATAN